MKSYKSRCHVWPKPPDQLDWKINLWNHKRRLPEKRSCSPICVQYVPINLPVPYIYLEPGVDIMKFSTPADCSFEGLWRSAIRSSHLSAIRVTKITLEWVDSFELEDSLTKTKLISEHTENSNTEDWEPTPESLPTKSTCVIILSI